MRAAWQFHCASDAEIEVFIEKDRIDPKLFELIAAIEKLPLFEGKILSHIKDNAMKAMHGYTHGGIHQVSRRMNGDNIEAYFEDAELLEVIRLTMVLALLAFAQIASLAGREDLVEAAEALMVEEPLPAADQ